MCAHVCACVLNFAALFKFVQHDMSKALCCSAFVCHNSSTGMPSLSLAAFREWMSDGHSGRTDLGNSAGSSLR